MANTNAPRGFEAYCMKSGAPYNGAVNKYYKGTTANMIIAVGDPVLRIASTDANGFPEITRYTTGAACTGIVVGIEPNISDLSKQRYLGASDTGYVLVCDDPNVLYKVQEGGAGTALAVAQIGKHIDSVAAVDANTITGQSQYQLDNNAVASANTFRIEGLVHSPDNVVGAYAKWLVSINLDTEVNAGASNLSEVA